MAHLHAGVSLAASISLWPVQLSSLQEVGGSLSALTQCIVGQCEVELKVWEPLGLWTGLSSPQQFQTLLRLSWFYISRTEVVGTSPDHPRVLQLKEEHDGRLTRPWSCDTHTSDVQYMTSPALQILKRPWSRWQRNCDVVRSELDGPRLSALQSPSLFLSFSHQRPPHQTPWLIRHLDRVGADFNKLTDLTVIFKNDTF